MVAEPVNTRRRETSARRHFEVRTHILLAYSEVLAIDETKRAIEEGLTSLHLPCQLCLALCRRPGDVRRVEPHGCSLHGVLRSMAHLGQSRRWRTDHLAEAALVVTGDEEPEQHAHCLVAVELRGSADAIAGPQDVITLQSGA